VAVSRSKKLDPGAIQKIKMVASGSLFLADLIDGGPNGDTGGVKRAR
jgi:hypothetical protein